MFSYKIVHKVCYQFPHGRLLVPREFENNTYNAKFCWGKQIAARGAWKSEIERREVEVQFHCFKFGLLCLKVINIHYRTQTKSKMKWNQRKNWATAKCVRSGIVIDREQNVVADSLLYDFKNKDGQSLKTTIKWFFTLFVFMKVFFLQKKILVLIPSCESAACFNVS